MLALNPKALAVIATMTSISSSVLGCLQLTGHVQNGFAVQGYITAVDNGVQTCDGDITDGDNNVGASQGAL